MSVTDKSNDVDRLKQDVANYESDLKDTIRVLDARKPEPRKSGLETKLPDKLGISKMSILAR